MKKNNKIMFTRKHLEHLNAFHLFGKLRVLVSSDEVDIEEFEYIGGLEQCTNYAIKKAIKHNVDSYINGSLVTFEDNEGRSKAIAQNGNEGTHYDNNAFIKDILEGEDTKQDKVLERKNTPIYSGFIKYFPTAIAEVSRASLIANSQHNYGKHLHWDMDKSTDELDALMRHLTDYARGEELDDDGIMHITKVCWRSMAMLERILTNKVK